MIVCLLYKCFGGVQCFAVALSRLPDKTNRCQLIITFSTLQLSFRCAQFMIQIQTQEFLKIYSMKIGLKSLFLCGIFWFLKISCGFRACTDKGRENWDCLRHASGARSPSLESGARRQKDELWQVFIFVAQLLWKAAMIKDSTSYCVTVSREIFLSFINWTTKFYCNR